MKTSIDKSRIWSKWRGCLFGAVVTSTLIVSGLLCASVIYQILPYRASQAATPVPVASPTNSQPTLDPANLQLVERVKDANTFLDTTVKLISVLAALIGAGLALAVWKTDDYANDLVREHFLSLKTEKLEPAVDASRQELYDLSIEGTKVILGASDILLNDLFQEFVMAYKKLLEQKGVKGDTLNSRLRDEEESFRTSREVTQYLIASLSRDEDTVIGQCHNLSALVQRKDFDVKADLVLRHLASLLRVWGPGTSAWSEIRSLYNLVEQRKRSAK